MSKKYDCYIIVGHEPLLTLKTKETKETKESKDNIKINKTLLEILNKQENKQKNIFYLCADVHLCQHGEITLIDNNVVIQQIVMGTGGADLDKCPSQKIIKEDNIIYEVYNCYEKYGFGFLNIDFDENTYTSTFIPVIPKPLIRKLS